MCTECLDLFALEPRLGEVQALETVEHIAVLIEELDDHLYEFGLAWLVFDEINHCR